MKLQNFNFIPLPGQITILIDCGGGLVTIANSLRSPWTVAHQTSLSMGFPRQEYWSGLPFPSPGYLPDSRIEPESPTWQADFFYH